MSRFVWAVLMSIALLPVAACNAMYETTADRDARCRDGSADNTPETEARKIRELEQWPDQDAVDLDFRSIEELQAAVDGRHVLQGIALPDRRKVGHLTVRDAEGQKVTIGERSIVRIRGYMVGVPHVRRPDRASCNTKPGRQSRDYVLNLGELAGDTEFDSIIAVVTATVRRIQNSNQEWDLEKLRHIARDQTMVRVTGQLFYDSKHIVNSDPEAPVKDEPRRLSLWEIHPVKSIEVCSLELKADCRDSNAWVALEQWQP